jgi:hypothetical protein
LWLLGFVWAIGPWLALGLAAIMLAIAIRYIHRLAKTIEAKTIGQGFQEFLKLCWDEIYHRALLKGVLFTTIGCMAFAGLLAAGIQGIIQNSIQENAQKIIAKQSLSPPEVPVAESGGAIMDWMILAGLISAGVTAVIGFKVYRTLRQRASEFVLGQKSDTANRPIEVKLFHDNKAIGIVLLVIGCWFFWGFLSQFAGLLLLLPWLGALTSKPIPAIIPAATVFLLALWILMMTALTGPLAWFSWRNLKLQIRHIIENDIARRLFNIYAVFLVGCFGLLLNMYLIELLGRRLWPTIFH